MNVPKPRETRPDRSYVPWYRRMIPRRRTVAVMIALLLATPVGIRWYRLWRMPDVPVPFDVEEFSQVPPEDENAFYYFRQAADRHKSSDMSLENQWLGPHGEVLWEHVPENVRTWVEQGQTTLRLFRQGARCSSASRIPPTDHTFWQSVFKDPVIRSIEDMSRLARLEAARLMHSGQTEETAELLNDSFRATRHLGRRGGMDDRSSGRHSHWLSSLAWRQWSQHPQVTADDIDAALMRIREDWKLTPPASDQFKVEYFGDLEVVNSSMTDWRNQLDGWLADNVFAHTRCEIQPLLSRFGDILPGWQVPCLWTLGEPELTARAIRMELTHVLKYCDLPYADFPPLVDGSLRETTELTGGLTARRLNERIHRSMFTSIVIDTMFPIEGHLEANRHEAARQALLETELSLQAQFRRRGVASRADVEQLAAEFPWPVDPCSAERRPLRFRSDDQGLVIWSVGPDDRDDNGPLEEENRMKDVTTVIPWPKAE